MRFKRLRIKENDVKCGRKETGQKQGTNSMVREKKTTCEMEKGAKREEEKWDKRESYTFDGRAWGVSFISDKRRSKEEIGGRIEVKWMR